MRLGSLHIYPVKGGHRVPLARSEVQPWGLAGDRRWLITDSDGAMLTQREEPKLTQVYPSLVDGWLALAAAGAPSLRIPALAGELEDVTVWTATMPATRVGTVADDWLGNVLDRKARLYYLDDPTRRRVDQRFGRPDDVVNLADEFPVLLTNSASLAALNDWIAESGSDEGPLPMTRFRPNLVIDDAPPWAEDDWLGHRIRIGAVTFRVVKPCGRCVVTTTDQETGDRGREPLRTLGRYRNVGQQLLFGTNLIPDDTGEIAVGDPAVLLD